MHFATSCNALLSHSTASVLVPPTSMPTANIVPILLLVGLNLDLAQLESDGVLRKSRLDGNVSPEISSWQTAVFAMQSRPEKRRALFSGQMKARYH